MCWTLRLGLISALCSSIALADGLFANGRLRQSPNDNKFYFCAQGRYVESNGRGYVSEQRKPDGQVEMLAAGLLLAIDAEIQETNDWVSTVGSAVTSNSQALSAVSQQMTQINSVLVQKVDTFTADVRKAINDRFQNLPAELVSSPVIQKLKADIEADILKQVSATLANGNQKAPVVPGPAKP